MRLLEVKLFRYAELSEEAKAKAREWLSEKLSGDWFEPDEITDQLKNDCEAYHGFQATEIYWDYNGPVLSFSATIDFEELGKGGDSHPELRAEMASLAAQLKSMEWECWGKVEANDGRSHGPRSTEVSVANPNPNDCDHQLAWWLKHHAPQDELYASALEGLERDEPDYAPILVALDWWEERGGDVSEPRALYKSCSPEAEKKGSELTARLEGLLGEWAEKVCRDLRKFMMDEVDYQMSEERAHEQLMDSDWEFTEQGKRYRG
jgi:hypothetical protein